VIELKSWQWHYRIDEDAGKVWLVFYVQRGKKLVERLMLFKGFQQIQEAYEYLSQVTRWPVWKLRKIAKRIEEKK